MLQKLNFQIILCYLFTFRGYLLFYTTTTTVYLQLSQIFSQTLAWKRINYGVAAKVNKMVMKYWEISRQSHASLLVRISTCWLSSSIHHSCKLRYFYKWNLESSNWQLISSCCLTFHFAWNPLRIKLCGGTNNQKGGAQNGHNISFCNIMNI